MNGAAYLLTTNSTGFGEKALKLEAVDGQATTYRVMAMFDGTNPQTRNLTVPTPNGQDYAVCTTIQFDCKPSMNTATLTVEAPKTDATAQKETSQQQHMAIKLTLRFTSVKRSRVEEGISR